MATGSVMSRVIGWVFALRAVVYLMWAAVLGWYFIPDPLPPDATDASDCCAMYHLEQVVAWIFIVTLLGGLVAIGEVLAYVRRPPRTTPSVEPPA